MILIPHKRTMKLQKGVCSSSGAGSRKDKPTSLLSAKASILIWSGSQKRVVSIKCSLPAQLKSQRPKTKTLFFWNNQSVFIKLPGKTHIVLFFFCILHWYSGIFRSRDTFSACWFNSEGVLSLEALCTSCNPYFYLRSLSNFFFKVYVNFSLLAVIYWKLLLEVRISLSSFSEVYLTVERVIPGDTFLKKKPCKILS